MGQRHAYAAIDLGAESGRMVKGMLADGKITLQEIVRFPNGMVPIAGHFHWNLIRLYETMLEGFQICAASKTGIESIGVDSWGVDFVLLSEDGSLMGLPVAYRDSRTDGMMETLSKRIPAETIYEKTGIAFMKFNSIYQLLAMAEQKSDALKHAAHFLMIPDYFHYLFTGKITNEYTDATTSQGVNLQTGTWDEDIFEAIGVSANMLHKLIKPGTTIGPLHKQLQTVTGLGPVPVIAPGTHDTASAVAAVPAEGKHWAYISSGTWSLMGMEAGTPVSSRKAFEYNFTNEGGVFNTIRFLKNIMGLWLVQRCRADFGDETDYGTLTELAADAPAFVSLIDPDRDVFMNPPSMTEAIADFCKQTSQPIPDGKGAFVRCCLESLALQYRLVARQLEEVYNTKINKLHIVGGGTQNTLLNQLAADATGLTVITGPVEATVIGNLVTQAIGAGHIDSLDEARKIIRNSFEMKTYTPKDTARWDEQFDRFMKLKQVS